MTKCKLNCVLLSFLTLIFAFLSIYILVYKRLLRKFIKVTEFLGVRFLGTTFPSFHLSTTLCLALSTHHIFKLTLSVEFWVHPQKSCPVMHCPALHICGQSNYLICSQDRRQLPDPAFWATQKRRPESWTGRQVCLVQQCRLDEAVSNRPARTYVAVHGENGIVSVGSR